MKNNSAVLHEPTEAEIQHQAYLIWCEGGCRDGTALEDWRAAQELLLHRHGRAHPAPKILAGKRPALGAR